MSNLPNSRNAIDQHEDVRVGMSNLAISGDAIDQQQQGVETSERGRWNTNVHTGVQMDETELRRYFALMAEEAEEEQREWSEYVREMHRQCRKPLGRAWMRRHRETQDLNQHHPLGYCGNGNLLS